MTSRGCVHCLMMVKRMIERGLVMSCTEGKLRRPGVRGGWRLKDVYDDDGGGCRLRGWQIMFVGIGVEYRASSNDGK